MTKWSEVAARPSRSFRRVIRSATLSSSHHRDDRPHRGSIFNIHAHVLAEDSPESVELRAFRDRLRADPALVAACVRRKREIIATGVTDGIDYTRIKGEFVKRTLAE